MASLKDTIITGVAKAYSLSFSRQAILTTSTEAPVSCVYPEKVLNLNAEECNGIFFAYSAPDLSWSPDNSAWTQITGANGATGYTGSAGARGTTGGTGTRGTTGFRGSAGAGGATGDGGAVGTTGYRGSQGPDGYQGSRGLTGYDGSKGLTGYTGSVGATGATGALSTGIVNQTMTSMTTASTASGTLAGTTGIAMSVGHTYVFSTNLYAANRQLALRCCASSSTGFGGRVAFYNRSATSYAYNWRTTRVTE